MASLSAADGEDETPTVVANPINITQPFTAEPDGFRLRFEVPANCARDLAAAVGMNRHYSIDSALTFWGVLETLEPCDRPSTDLAEGPYLQGALRMGWADDQ